MAKILKCDICKKETDEIVAKLFVTPLSRGNTANSFHNRYSHHADVGVCCMKRLMDGFNFRKRVTAKQYQESRRRT